MEELGRKPEIVDDIETYVFNSDKCLALFKPWTAMHFIQIYQKR